MLGWLRRSLFGPTFLDRYRHEHYVVIVVLKTGCAVMFHKVTASGDTAEPRESGDTTAPREDFELRTAYEMNHYTQMTFLGTTDKTIDELVLLARDLALRAPNVEAPIAPMGGVPTHDCHSWSRNFATAMALGQGSAPQGDGEARGRQVFMAKITSPFRHKLKPLIITSFGAID